MELSCPKCRSGEVRRLSLVFREGLSHVDTSTRTVGIGIGAGRLGVGAAQGATTGTHQTVLSREAAPPQRKGVSGPIFAAIISGLFVLVGLADFSGFTVLCCIVCAGSIWLARISMRFNRDEFPRLLQAWENSFLCTRCGESFVAFLS
jgi:hypothetical protein